MSDKKKESKTLRDENIASVSKNEEDFSKNKEETIECEVNTLKLQLSELKDRLLRAIAETQNIQKRAEKEKSDISKYGISAFAKDILIVRDNLQFAINSCSESDNKIVDGIKLTMSEMDKILSSYGIKMIESINAKFDPNIHQAMIQVKESNKEPGIVVQVMQEGYTINDRLLRPALVGVSSK